MTMKKSGKYFKKKKLQESTESNPISGELGESEETSKNSRVTSKKRKRNEGESSKAKSRKERVDHKKGGNNSTSKKRKRNEGESSKAKSRSSGSKGTESIDNKNGGDNKRLKLNPGKGIISQKNKGTGGPCVLAITVKSGYMLGLMGKVKRLGFYQRQLRGENGDVKCSIHGLFFKKKKFLLKKKRREKLRKQFYKELKKILTHDEEVYKFLRKYWISYRFSKKINWEKLLETKKAWSVGKLVFSLLIDEAIKHATPYEMSLEYYIRKTIRLFKKLNVEEILKTNGIFSSETNLARFPISNLRDAFLASTKNVPMLDFLYDACSETCALSEVCMPFDGNENMNGCKVKYRCNCVELLSRGQGSSSSGGRGNGPKFNLVDEEHEVSVLSHSQRSASGA